VGFIQFLAPTLQFACGVWAGEALTPLRVASFVFIWAGAGVFALAAFRRSRAARQAIRETAEPA
jgi:chloramphenicol-sensitive protein RarD